MNDHKSRDVFLRRHRTTEVVFRLYGMIGAMLAVLSGGYFLLRKMQIIIDRQDQWILMSFSAGVLLVFLSRVVLEYYKVVEVRRSALAESEMERYKLLSLWASFESAASSYLGEDIRGRPVPTRELIYRLVETGAISRSQFEDLEQALDIRNAVAHGREDVFPPALIDRASTALDSILQLLHRPDPQRAKPRARRGA